MIEGDDRGANADFDHARRVTISLSLNQIETGQWGFQPIWPDSENAGVPLRELPCFRANGKSIGRGLEHGPELYFRNSRRFHDQSTSL